MRAGVSSIEAFVRPQHRGLESASVRVVSSEGERRTLGIWLGQRLMVEATDETTAEGGGCQKTQEKSNYNAEE